MINFKKYDDDSDLIKNGFQVFKKGISEVYIRAVKRNLEELATECKHTDVFRTKLGDIKQIQNLNVSHGHTIVSEISLMCASLIGADLTKIKVLNNQFFAKPPNYKMTSAHQDNAYFGADKSRKVYTFWIPLQDVNIFNSCMFYVPNSHLDGIVEHKPIGTNTRTRTGVKGVSMYSDVYNNSEFVETPMFRGDVLVHDKDCMHFSSPNLSDEYRTAFTVILEVLD
jgi:ectoine hydroxylase-related dioxygenase (phytanoyl-CoA dioxygenase family)